MKIPPLLGLNEMAELLGLSKARVRQLADTKTFPDHFVRLHIGRIWLTSQVLSWAAAEGRPCEAEIDDGYYGQLAQALAIGVNGSPHVANDSGYRDALRAPNYLGTSRPVTILPEEREVVDSGEKNVSSSLATLASKETRSAAADPAETPKPSRRAAAELNQQALADELDDLQRIWETAKANGELPESEVQLVGFATMVIVSLGNVPNYRRTRASMVKAWGEVRQAYSPSPVELVALATHVATQAVTPWSPGAVKKFSDYEITKIRRTSTPTQSSDRSQPDRWQGAHGSYEDEIAKLTPEERKRYGVAPR